MTPEITSAFAQLGAAGLIGLMWLTERRAAAAREKQLGDLHERIMQERTHIAALLSVVSDNTRALTALETGQRSLADTMERLAQTAVPR